MMITKGDILSLPVIHPGETWYLLRVWRKRRIRPRRIPAPSYLRWWAWLPPGVRAGYVDVVATAEAMAEKGLPP